MECTNTNIFVDLWSFRFNMLAGYCKGYNRGSHLDGDLKQSALQWIWISNICWTDGISFITELQYEKQGNIKICIKNSFFLIWRKCWEDEKIGMKMGK